MLSFIHGILESAYMQCEVVAEAERQALVDEETAKVCVETAEAAYMRAEAAAAAAQRLAEETRATADKLAKEATEVHKVDSLAAAATAAAHQVSKGACEVAAVAKTYAQEEAARAFDQKQNWAIATENRKDEEASMVYKLQRVCQTLSFDTANSKCDLIRILEKHIAQKFEVVASGHSTTSRNQDVKKSAHALHL